MTVLDDCQKTAQITAWGSSRGVASHALKIGARAAIEAFLSHPDTREQLAQLLWEKHRDYYDSKTWDGTIADSRALSGIDAGALLDELRKELVDGE